MSFGKRGKMFIKPFKVPKEKRLFCILALLSNTEFIKNGCWLWRGRIHNGYGCITVPKFKSTLWVHRLSFALFKEAIKTGNHVDHTCRTPNCLNPAHLEQKTPTANCQEIYKRKRQDELAIINTRQYQLF